MTKANASADQWELFFFQSTCSASIHCIQATTVLELLSAVLIDCRRRSGFRPRRANAAVLQTAALSAVIAAQLSRRATAVAGR